MLALMEGRLADAEQLISETLEQGRRSQSWNAVVSERFAVFVLRRAQGRLAEFEDTIKRSVDEYPPLLRFRCALADAYGELGRKDDAGVVLDDLMTHDLGHEHLDAEWLLSMTLLADPCALLDDQDAAARLHALLASYEARPWLAHAQHDLATMLLRRGAVGDDKRAFALLNEAHDIYRELDMTSWAARASGPIGASRSRPSPLP